ncbi:unnamed protein product [Aureobasidium pullulans]|nr:unnamed protein product [Aureobasidium pullulans]
MFGVSYWILPIFAACCWLGTLLGMLGTWIAQGSPRYVSMEPGQKIAYISDIGAQGLQPLFIAGSAVTVVVFDCVFISERWLRHQGRLAHNTSNVQKGLSIGACLFALAGAAGLITLTILDTVNHPRAHDIGLGIFMYVHPYRVLRASFWIKLAFIFVEIALAIAFVALGRHDSQRNKAAILEWVISLVYIIYVGHYCMDFFPAVHSKDNRFPSNPMRNGQTVEPSRNF